MYNASGSNISLPTLPVTPTYVAASPPGPITPTGATMLTMNNFSPSGGPFGYINQSQVIRLNSREALPEPLSPQMVSKIKQVRTWAKAVRQFPEGQARNQEMNRILDYCASSEPMIIPQLRLCVHGIWARDQLQPADTQDLVNGLSRMDANQWPKALRRSGWDKRLQDPGTLNKLINQLMTEFSNPEIQLQYLTDLIRALRPNESLARTMIEATRQLPESVRIQICKALINACWDRLSPMMETTLIDMICRHSGPLKDSSWKEVLVPLSTFSAMTAIESQIALMTSISNLEKSSAIRVLECFRPKFETLKKLAGTLENDYACSQASRLLALAFYLSIKNDRGAFAVEVLGTARSIAGQLGQPSGGQLLLGVMTDFLTYVSGDATKLVQAVPAMLKSLAGLEPNQTFSLMSALTDYLVGVDPQALPPKQWDELFDALQETCAGFANSDLAVPLMTRLTLPWRRLPSADPDTRYAIYAVLVQEICPQAIQSAMISRYETMVLTKGGAGGGSAGGSGGGASERDKLRH